MHRPIKYNLLIVNQFLTLKKITMNKLILTLSFIVSISLLFAQTEQIDPAAPQTEEVTPIEDPSGMKKAQAQQKAHHTQIEARKANPELQKASAPGDEGLNVERGNHVKFTGDGYAIFGDNTSFNIATDGANIEARNGLSNLDEILYLNYWDGDVYVGTGSDNPSDTYIGTSSTNTGFLNAYNTLYVDGNADEVGVGTSTPSTKFHVQADGYSEMARFQSDVGSKWISFYDGADRQGIIWNTGADMVFRADNAGGSVRLQTDGFNDRLIANATGVGISTTPATKLHTTVENATNITCEVTDDGVQTTVGGGSAIQVESLYKGLDVDLNSADLTGTRYGVNVDNFISGTSGVTTGSHYGGYFYTSGARTGSNYSVYGDEGATDADIANWGVYCRGAGFITSSWTTSDQKLKNNIQDIAGALDQINLLRPKTYTYDRIAYKNMNLPEGDQMGFIAQDLEQVFPSLIRDAESPEITAEQAANSDREASPAVAFKAVNHQPLIALLTKGIQELSQENVLLKQQLDQQQQMMTELRAEMNAIKASVNK